MAITQSPMRICSDFPSGTSVSGLTGSTLSTARSVLESAPTSSALSFEPSAKLTSMSSAPSMT
jgi:hypothetical protein